jgi:hypothetical protein
MILCVKFPKARGRGRSRADGATSSRIVLMLVKKPGNQLLQLELTGRVIHRSSVLKELPLDFSRKIIPLHDHRRAKTSQHALFSCTECQSWSKTRSRGSRGSALVVPTIEGFGKLI